MRHSLLRVRSWIVVAGFLLEMVSLPVWAGEAFQNPSIISNAELRQYDTRTLGRMIVERLRKQCDEEHGEAGKGLSDKSAVVMLLPHQHLASVIQNGFLNQHVTNVTNGYHGPFERFGAEMGIAHLRLPYSQKAKALLPKYALFNIKVPGHGSLDIPSWYGDLLFVFKRSVLERTTWTPQDSLTFDYDIDNGFYPARTPYYVQKKGKSFKCIDYCEAQIWGELDFSDVAYAMIEDSAPEEVFKEAFALLQGTGVAVFRFKRQEMPNQVFRVKRLGAPISSVNPKLLKGPLQNSTRAQLDQLLQSLPSEAAVARSIVQGKIRELKSVEELSQEILSSQVLSRNRLYALAELATRGGPQVLDVVQKLLSQGEWKDDDSQCGMWGGQSLDEDNPGYGWMLRLQVLTAMSDFPGKELDQLISKGILDPCRDVWMTAISLAMPRLESNPALQTALKVFYETAGSNTLKRNWYDALNRKNICSKNPPDPFQDWDNDDDTDEDGHDDPLLH